MEEEHFVLLVGGDGVNSVGLVRWMLYNVVVVKNSFEYCLEEGTVCLHVLLGMGGDVY